MGLIPLLLLIGAFDVAGIFLNFRLLWRCFKGKMQTTFLQKCRVIVAWQTVCHVTIFVADAVKSWKGFDIQPGETCNVLIALSMSMMLFHACNITTIVLLYYYEHREEIQNREASSKLKISIALSLGFISSAAVWWYCFSQQFLAKVSAVVACVCTVVFDVVQLSAAASMARANNPGQTEEITSGASMNKSYLLWNVCKKDKKPLSFTVLLVTCLVVTFTDVPRSSIYFKEILCLLITRFVFGIVVPFTVSNMIAASCKVSRNQQDFIFLDF